MLRYFPSFQMDSSVNSWIAACQASLYITNSWSLPKLISIESVMPSNHLILCCPFLLPPSIFPSIGVFSNESILCIRWPKCWSFNFSISPSNEHPGLISLRMDWLDLLAVQGTLKSLQHDSSKKINNLTVYLSFLTGLWPTLHSAGIVRFLQHGWLMPLCCYFLYLQIHLSAILIQLPEMILLRTSSLLSQIFCESVTIRISSVQLLSHVWLFATPWTAALQASLSITNSRSPRKHMSIE